MEYLHSQVFLLGESFSGLPSSNGIVFRRGCGWFCGDNYCGTPFTHLSVMFSSLSYSMTYFIILSFNDFKRMGVL